MSIERYIQKLGIKIHKGYFKPYEEKVEMSDFEEDVPIPMRKRKRRKCNISQNEKLDIIHDVLVQH
jgi:hypothetical protein